MAELNNHTSTTVTSPYPWQFEQFEQLAELYKKQRLPHALLIHGEKGLGKLRFALSLSQFLLCENEQESQAAIACGHCKACQLFAAKTHPDILTIQLEEKAKQIKVDQIRKLVDFVAKTSQREGMKIIIIEPAESMNINAANALLKSLEEPTANTLIFMITHAAHRLLPTIRSRCQSVAIDKPNQTMADEWLSTYLQDANKRHQLLSIANGNPLQARQLDEEQYLDIFQLIANYYLFALQGQQQSPLSISEKMAKFLDIRSHL